MLFKVFVTEKFSKFFFNLRAYHGPLTDRLVMSVGFSIRQNTGHSGNHITETNTHKSPDVTSNLTMDLFPFLCFMILYAFRRNHIKFIRQSKKITWSQANSKFILNVSVFSHGLLACIQKMEHWLTWP